jgi:hypothetical protein
MCHTPKQKKVYAAEENKHKAGSYMNILAKVLSIGPLKLLLQVSLRHQCTVSANQKMVTQTRTETIKKWQKR